MISIEYHEFEVAQTERVKQLSEGETITKRDGILYLGFKDLTDVRRLILQY